MPVPPSPYHFYERKGFRIRESHPVNKGKTVEVEVDGKFIVVVSDERSTQRITEALNTFIARNTFRLRS